MVIDNIQAPGTDNQIPSAFNNSDQVLEEQ